MSETFYRVHWADCPAFSLNNAWSALWGGERSKDGSQTRCRHCSGTGRVDPEYRACRPCFGTGDNENGHTCRTCDGDGTVKVDECRTCGGDGWELCIRGYSCFRTPEELVAYIDERGYVSEGDVVIIFAGRQVGTGFDGEPTALPEQVLERLPWAEFTARTAREQTRG